jgi:hypothetical protein
VRPRDCAEIAEDFRLVCLQNGRKPTGRAGSKLNIPQESVWKIVCKSFALRPYLAQMMQNLAPNNKAPRFEK